MPRPHSELLDLLEAVGMLMEEELEEVEDTMPGWDSRCREEQEPAGRHDRGRRYTVCPHSLAPPG